jgi:hypothetical protein
MLNSLREWGERRSTRVFALKIAQKHLEFEGAVTPSVFPFAANDLSIDIGKYQSI